MRTNFELKNHDNHNDDDSRSRSGSGSHKILYRYAPFFIVFISIFELVVFVYYSLRAEDPISFIGPVPFKSKLIYDPYRRYEIWRYFTYMFIHAGYWHIVFNILLQLAVGVPLETVHGFNAIFVIYTGGIIGGALGNSIADPHTFLAGASSGCYALIAAHLSNLIINWRELKGRCTQLIALITFTSIDFGTAVYERHFKTIGLAYRTSYGGHMAGAASGLLLGLVFLSNIQVHRWEQRVVKAAIVIYATLVIFAILFNLLYSDYFPLPDTRDLLWSQSPFARDRE